MPGIFAKRDGQWRIHPVGMSPSLLRLDPASVEPSARLESSANACLLVRIAGGRQWAALVADEPRVHHNGTRIAAGLRMLEHRDALALAGAESLFFTAEEPAFIEPFAATAAVTCPRCRGEVHLGDNAVRCPSCGVMHHETVNRNCWTYAPTCALCSQPTALDAGLRWTPEEL